MASAIGLEQQKNLENGSRFWGLNKMKKLAKVLVLGGTILAMSASWATEQVDLDVAPNLVVSNGNPQDAIYANAGENLRTGVGSIFIGFDNGGFICSAAAISPTHILTAAHCVRNPGGLVQQLVFVLNAGLGAPLLIDAVGFEVHPAYDFFEPVLGAIAPGDIAVVELGSALPAGVDIYGLYEGSSELGSPARHYGHGRSGDGKGGATEDSDFFYGRTGLNRYETTLAPFLGGDPLFNAQLISDFDSGGARHNALDWWFSPFACHKENLGNPAQAQDGRCTSNRSNTFPDKGFKKLEIGVAPGDSGGPAFIEDKIAGVHSFGFTNSCAGETNQPDRLCGLNSSHGELSGDTRVSAFVAWIDAVMNFGTSNSIPELIIVGESVPANGANALELNSEGRMFLEQSIRQTLRQQVN